MRIEFKVVAILKDETAKIEKTQHGFRANVMYQLEDGRLIPYYTSHRLKRDLIKELSQLPNSVKGLAVTLYDNGRIESTIHQLSLMGRG